MGKHDNTFYTCICNVWYCLLVKTVSSLRAGARLFSIFVLSMGHACLEYFRNAGIKLGFVRTDLPIGSLLWYFEKSFNLASSRSCFIPHLSKDDLKFQL